MDQYRQFNEIIKSTSVLRMPKRSIATFGPTDVSYYFLAALSESATRVREGFIRARKPKIIIPGRTEELIEGFDPQARELAEILLKEYGQALRMLGYTFNNELKETSTQSQSLERTAERIFHQLEDNSLVAVVSGPDASWQISMIKFLSEMVRKSFPGNMTELEEHGFFDPERPLRIARAQIERLFEQAASGSGEKTKELGALLLKHGLFEEYEDRFFVLLKKTSA